MSILAEELVEEWLNRDGFFTIRGIKVGVGEMDLLAIKPAGSGLLCRHMEVQDSVNPISYLCGLPRNLQVELKLSAFSAKHRTRDVMEESEGTRGSGLLIAEGTRGSGLLYCRGV
jgi:hypothetical protein